MPERLRGTGRTLAGLQMRAALRLPGWERTTTIGPVSDDRLPFCLRRRSDVDALREDVAGYLGTTVAERSEILGRLCRFAAEQVAARPDGRRILEYQERRSTESEALWRRWMRLRRGE